MLDISTWKEYKFDDIFLIRKGFYNKKPEHTSIGYIPFLGATEYNNGVTEYYSLEDIEEASKTGDENNVPLTEKIFPGKSLCVTNNGSVGFAFYQESEFTCSHDVNPLYIKNGEFNKATALFVATVISADRYRWAYGRKWRPERMKNSYIKLPADKNGTPDWKFMEMYIQSIEHKDNLCKGTIKDSLYTENINYKNLPPLDITKWGDFRIDDIFTVKYGVNLEVINCEETDATDSDAVNFVSRVEGNNGVSTYIKRIEGLMPQDAGVITCASGGSVLSTFLQTEPFYSGRDLYLLIAKDKNMSNLVKLFICTIIKFNKYKYSYGRQANKTLASLKLKLPVDDTGKLDYHFMESYIKALPYGDRV